MVRRIVAPLATALTANALTRVSIEILERRLDRNLGRPARPGRELAGIPNQMVAVASAHPLRIGGHARAHAGNGKQTLDEVPHAMTGAGADIIGLARGAAREEERVGPNDVADVA